VIITIQNSVLS